MRSSGACTKQYDETVYATKWNTHLGWVVIPSAVNEEFVLVFTRGTIDDYAGSRVPTRTRKKMDIKISVLSITAVGNRDQGRPGTPLRTASLRPRTMEKGLGESL